MAVGHLPPLGNLVVLTAAVQLLAGIFSTLGALFHGIVAHVTQHRPAFPHPTSARDVIVSPWGVVILMLWGLLLLMSVWRPGKG